MGNALRIAEDAWPARIAARVLRKRTCAMVLGETIFLWGSSRAEFLSDTRWVRHEAAHILQYRRLGVMKFLLHYLWYSLRYGYRENPLEAEARAAESDPDISEKAGLPENRPGGLVK